MKKFIKICALTGLILLLAGIGITCIRGPGRQVLKLSAPAHLVHGMG